MNIIVSNGIVVSGVGTPLNGIEWPSGQFAHNEPASQLCAFLSSINATFGFDVNPHTFNTEWIPCGNSDAFHGASGQLPEIGHSLELYVGDFYFRGNITHADYTTSAGGTIVNVTIEDDRKNLRRVKIHTEDLGEDAPSGVISIARAYRKINGLKDVNGDPNDPNIKEYRRILQFGSTYSQILAAIDLHYNENKCYYPITILPTVEQLESNTDESIDKLRFQFNLTPLDEALSRVLVDTGYDWYWSMDAQRVNLINKKVVFDISEADILNLVSQFGSASGLNETTQLGYGQDVVPDPTRFRVLGGHQEGFINSHLLSPIDGLDTFGLDGIVSKTVKNDNINVIFYPAWDRLTIGFYDYDGFYRTYIPTEKELQLALAGIEQWTYFKIYQTASPTANPPGYALPPDDGSIAAQHPTFQSRLDPIMPLAGLATAAAQSGLRVISNRRDEEQNWVLDFYSRVQNHASRHYGKSYVCEGLLFNQASGLFRLLDSAWANVENQVNGYPLSSSGVVVSGSGLFVEDYEISRELGPISPFVSEDFKVSAYCRLPANTVYGPLGDDNPASFGNWTEDAQPFNPTGNGEHYIPVTINIVGNRVIDPRSNELYSFEAFPEGTLWCQLPTNAGPASGLIEDNVISSLSTVFDLANRSSGSGLLDVVNPATILNAYPLLSGVAIPVEARSRYGQYYPNQWVLGDLHYQDHEEVQLDDQFVPWTYSPKGNQTTLQIMASAAVSRIRGKIVPKSSSRYADFQQIGLPLLSFDAFAEQGIGPSGYYGEISHGVNEVNISFGTEGFTTRYKIQSYFPKFGQDAPLGEKVRAQLNGILNPIDYTELSLLDPLPTASPNPTLPGDAYVPPVFFDSQQRSVKVTITETNNIFTLLSLPGTEGDERYRGITQNGVTQPPISFGSSNPDFTDGAICIDGFLNIGDQAIYHNDQFELPDGNTILRYFTQGRPFGNGTIVQVAAQGTASNKYDVLIVDNVGVSRAIKDIEVLNGSVSIGDKTTLVSQGNAPVRPGPSNGTLYIYGTTPAFAGVTPVEITAVSNAGTNLALATCQELGFNSAGVFSLASGQLHYGAVPIPFREFAAVGDRGFLLTTTATPSGGFGQTKPVTFIEIVRPAYRNF